MRLILRLPNVVSFRRLGRQASRLRSDHETERLAAIAALSSMDDPRVVPFFVSALSDPSRSVRRAAIDALAAKEMRGTVEALIRVVAMSVPATGIVEALRAANPVLSAGVPMPSRADVVRLLGINPELGWVAVQALERSTDPAARVPRVRSLMDDCRIWLFMQVMERQVEERIRSSSPQSRGDAAALGERRR
jgi:hypothetical protein